jgi:hypothetical protein
MEIDTYLASLGKTSAEVAESLRKQGVKGVRSTRYNPIVNGIYDAIPDFPRGLQTPFGHGHHGFEGHWTIDAIVRVDPRYFNPKATALPQPVQDFIGQFMKGQWWDLVSDDEEDDHARAEEDRLYLLNR